MCWFLLYISENSTHFFFNLKMKYKTTVQGANEAIHNIAKTTEKLLNQQQISAKMVVEHLRKIQHQSEKIEQYVDLEREGIQGQ